MVAFPPELLEKGSGFVRSLFSKTQALILNYDTAMIQKEGNVVKKFDIGPWIVTCFMILGMFSVVLGENPYANPYFHPEETEEVDNPYANPYGQSSETVAGNPYDNPYVNPYDEPEVKQIIGDVDGDGQVTSFDASLILQYEAGMIEKFPIE